MNVLAVLHTVFFPANNTFHEFVWWLLGTIMNLFISIIGKVFYVFEPFHWSLEPYFEDIRAGFINFKLHDDWALEHRNIVNMTPFRCLPRNNLTFTVTLTTN
mmetsp:Transcript_77505/g.209081  ORF Transcript_77505/g.209081 Transcript_77505/m.209081 type:complete len:102 (-) Transcript_77505:132-437(-)